MTALLVEQVRAEKVRFLAEICSSSMMICYSPVFYVGEEKH